MSPTPSAVPLASSCRGAVSSGQVNARLAKCRTVPRSAILSAHRPVAGRGCSECPGPAANHRNGRGAGLRAPPRQPRSNRNNDLLVIHMARTESLSEGSGGRWGQRAWRCAWPPGGPLPRRQAVSVIPTYRSAFDDAHCSQRGRAETSSPSRQARSDHAGALEPPPTAPHQPARTPSAQFGGWRTGNDGGAALGGRGRRCPPGAALERIGGPPAYSKGFDVACATVSGPAIQSVRLKLLASRASRVWCAAGFGPGPESRASADTLSRAECNKRLSSLSGLKIWTEQPRIEAQ
jgi:hypothetical protein